MMLRLYDFPEATAHSPNRTATTTPLQQLYVLNGPLLQQLASAMAADLTTSESTAGIDGQIGDCYRSLFQRSPTDSERQLARDFLTAASAEAPPTRATWEAYLHVLLGLNELFFLD